MKIEEAIKSTQPISLSNKVMINLMYTARYVEQKATNFKTHDLTPQQYNVLRILRGQKGNPANLSTLQERMIDKSSNTTRLVDKLITKGLSQRRVCPENRRKVEIFITSKGMELLQELDPIIESQNKNIVNTLSAEEQETLSQLLDKLRND